MPFRDSFDARTIVDVDGDDDDDDDDNTLDGEVRLIVNEVEGFKG
jgi:hypothetical protein